jgi:putative ABC transport system permease protein
MIKHLFTLVWNRKRANGLIVAEVLISFLVLCALGTIGIHYLTNYLKPIGFEYENVWNIQMVTGLSWGDWRSQQAMGTVQLLVEHVRGYPEVEGVSTTWVAPFSGGEIHTIIDGEDDEQLRVMYNEATDDFAEMMGMELIEGRWFNKTDDGQSWNPVVINASLKEKMFGDESPLGRVFRQEKERRTGMRPEERVVGVFTDFRHRGELREPYDMFFGRICLDDSTRFRLGPVLVKVQPGTTAEFEERLVAGMSDVAKGWSFRVKPLSQMRSAMLRDKLMPLAFMALVAGFLMLMVGFGLLGVLWQNVTRRTREIGLRRAVGAHAKSIYTQILTENLVVVTIGLAIGAIIVIQFPLLGIVEHIAAATFGYSVLFSALLIYGLAALCGLYPSWLAAQVRPARALHYE